MFANAVLATLIDVLERNSDIARAQENQILLFLVEGLKWLLRIKSAMFGKGLKEFEVELIAAIPAFNSA